MKRGPQVGNTKRNLKIYALYDTGEYSLKQIAAQITASGKHCTEDMVAYVIRRRVEYQKFYGEHFSGFSRIPHVETK